MLLLLLLRRLLLLKVECGVLWGVCGLVVALASNLDSFFIFEEGFELGAGPDAILRLSGRNFEARVSESFEGSVFGSTSNRRLPRLSLCTLGRKL